jgi:RHS repeat-associated protein
VRRSYGYKYDDLNRLLKGIYQRGTDPNNVSHSYDETLTYDKNGNIITLNRNGYLDVPTAGMTYPIDDLTYGYASNSNRLLSVEDQSQSIDGFKDGPVNDIDYDYDTFGNMITDRNKGIMEGGIKYNHLNLPTSITFDNGSTITYLYNAVGTKLGKTVTSVSPESGSVATQTDYLNGFQYKDNGLQFFPTAEGYVSVIEGQKFNYVFNYTDHLGNNRVSYSLDQADQQVKILEENHYYPFGLKHSNYNTDKVRFEKDENYNIFAVLKPVQRGDYQYKYNGKELQDELGLNMYDYGARNYDPAIGRWMNVDPLAEAPLNIGTSPYTYVWNNPLSFVDPDGMHGQTTIVGDNGNGTYTVKKWIDDGSTNVVLEDGTKVGESLTTHSFVNENNEAVVGAIIDTGSTEGQDFIDNEIIADDPNIFHYKDNAKLNEPFDFKSRGLDKEVSVQESLIHRTRGSMTSDGKMASARDFGNMAAGIVASRAGLPHWYARYKFNQLQGGNEPPVSAKAQQIGLNKGDKLFWKDYRKREYEKALSPWPTGSKL